jgi:AraC family transcriptional regulator
MQVSIENSSPKTLVGIHIKMSLSENKTGELWKSFMSQKDLIPNRKNQDFISLNIYPKGYFEKFNPKIEFEKWALAEVENFDNIPESMHAYKLSGGLYAIFNYRGSSNDASVFQHIYNEWLPQSNYQLDNRPHFEVLGSKYKNNDENSQEEIWIPIKPL